MTLTMVGNSLRLSGRGADDWPDGDVLLTVATVYALVRPKRGVGAEKRLDSQFVYYFGEKVPRRFRERLAFVEGDITDEFEVEKAGGGGRRKRLRLPPVNTVVNCAALVKHYVAFSGHDGFIQLGMSLGSLRQNMYNYSDEEADRILKDWHFSVVAWRIAWPMRARTDETCWR